MSTKCSSLRSFPRSAGRHSTGRKPPEGSPPKLQNLKCLDPTVAKVAPLLLHATARTWWRSGDGLGGESGRAGRGE
eukprot:9469465-Pyramimonas_sp.AAC.1